MKTFIKTADKVTVENYPYGFRLRTTLYDYIEFDKKKGYQHCTQTVNPKNGKLNAPKKSTYSPLMVRYYDENGYIKTNSFDFNGDTELNRVCKFVNENFDLFTKDEIENIYLMAIAYSKLDMKATVIYGGSKIEDLIPLYDNFVKAAVEGAKTGENKFHLMILDSEAINATKPIGFSPFKIRTYETA